MAELQKVLVARNAMATRFEVALYGEDPRQLRAAGEEALEEIERIESRISPFKPESEVFWVNRTAYRQPVRVSPDVFNLLKIARMIWEMSEGTFDITIGPLMKLWGFRGGVEAIPSEELIASIKSCCGMNFIELEETSRTIKFLNPELQIDLGAIGKGYAIDCAVEVLRESGVSSALIHGGTSTAAAIGEPPPPEKWKIALELPHFLNQSDSTLVSYVELKDNSLSVSAIWGRKSELSDEFGHIIDPRSGKPTRNCVMAAVLHESATFSDALSTALLVGGEDVAKKISLKIGRFEYLIVSRASSLNSSSGINVFKTKEFKAGKKPTV